VALLNVDDLTISFAVAGQRRQPVSSLTFKVRHGETVALVGESGSGKSLTARAVMGLLPDGAELTGTVRFAGDLLVDNTAFTTGHAQCGRRMAMIFQEPMASLNPAMRVEELIGEAYRLRLGIGRRQARPTVREQLVRVGIAQPDELLGCYPWQLSGGLAQRVLIASALILEPSLLIADEPTTALDVTTQAQILRLLLELKERQGLSLLFITHDLQVAALMGGRLLILHSGLLLEQGATQSVLANPGHPYTRSLLACTPARALAAGRRRLTPDPGSEGAGGPA